MNKRAVGHCYEEKAAEYLKARGVQILEQNFRCKTGEVDLIGKEGAYLVFIEVKYRLSKRNGYAAEAVNHKKQQIISRVANFYLLRHFQSQEIPCRFDVIAFDGEEIRWYRNAFEYCP